jgi:hypothetical protein
MGAGSPPEIVIEGEDGAARDATPEKVRVVPRALWPRLPPQTDLAHRRRRLSKKSRPVYWEGIDWRDELKRCGRPNALDPSDQRKTRTCVGHAVASALRANIAIHRGVDPGPLNPFFIWGLARERDYQTRDGRAGLLAEALNVVSLYSTPRSNEPPTLRQVEQVPITPDLHRYARDFTKSPDEASLHKIQGFVNLGQYLGDYSAWLHAFGPIVVRVTIDRDSFDDITDGGRPQLTFDPSAAIDGTLSLRYNSHPFVVIGYRPGTDSFILQNSFGPRWGDNGCCYIDVPTAQRCFVAGYGLLFREHLGYTYDGQRGRQARSRLAAPDPSTEGAPRPAYKPRARR